MTKARDGPVRGADRDVQPDLSTFFGERQDSSTGTGGTCEAWNDTDGEPCSRDALPGIPYCGRHKHLVAPGLDTPG
jgi:hypothetical protein